MALSTAVAEDRTTSPPSSGGPDTGRRGGMLLALPFALVYGAFLLWPILYGALMSLFNTSTVEPGLGEFAGFGNFAEIFASSDFWESMWHTVQFTLYTTPPLVVLALTFALLTERVRRGRWFYRFAFFAPFVIPSAAVVLVWTWIYTPDIGLASEWVRAVGLPSPNWVGDPDWAMISVAALTVWWTVGFNYILYLAGLQDVPRELYDAAAVDGAQSWAQLRYITVPLLARTTSLVIALQVVASLKVFDQIYLLLQGGPDFATRPALEYIYDVGFTDYRAGYAAAASVVYLALILVASLAWLALNRYRREA